LRRRSKAIKNRFLSFDPVEIGVSPARNWGIEEKDGSGSLK
jgi:hypothetical protein